MLAGSLSPGIKLGAVAPANPNNQTEIVLNPPGRDRKIEDYTTWLRTLGKAGFHFTLSNFNLAQIVSSQYC